MVCLYLGGDFVDSVVGALQLAQTGVEILDGGAKAVLEEGQVELDLDEVGEIYFLHAADYNNCSILWIVYSISTAGSFHSYY